jgi:hypothetical protein
VFGCISDHLHGLNCRDVIGLDTIVFEVDFPHSNGSWPNSRAISADLFAKAGMIAHECYRLLRGYAIDCYGLQRFGITH